MITELLYRCCFCNKMIDSGPIDPCDINILTKIDKPKDTQQNQTFYCHANCFEKCLHDKIRGYLVVNIDGDDE